MHDVDHTSLHRSYTTGIRRVSELYRASLKLKHLVPQLRARDRLWPTYLVMEESDTISNADTSVYRALLDLRTILTNATEHNTPSIITSVPAPLPSAYHSQNLLLLQVVYMCVQHDSSMPTHNAC